MRLGGPSPVAIASDPPEEVVQSLSTDASATYFTSPKDPLGEVGPAQRGPGGGFRAQAARSPADTRPHPHEAAPMRPPPASPGEVN